MRLLYGNPLASGTAEDDLVAEMLAAGVIERSDSPWESPVCLAKKPDGSYRFCVNYRLVNAVSRKDAYPIPDIQDAFDSLGGGRNTSRPIDLLSGYWRIGMTPRVQERSAFCIRRGLYHFNRVVECPRHLLSPDAQGTEGPPVAYLPVLSR